MHGCRESLLVVKYHGYSAGFRDLALADSCSRQVEVANKTEDRFIGSIFAGRHVSGITSGRSNLRANHRVQCMRGQHSSISVGP